MPDFSLSVTAATHDDETAFRNLFQFYVYEFSRFTHWRTNGSGRFLEADLDGCWSDPRRNPFIIRVDNDLAGLAIVDYLLESPHFNGQPTYQMAEFFVMAAFQGWGIGRRAAVRLFDHFRGRWQVSEMTANAPATHFWRHVITAYTGGVYREIEDPDAGVIVQLFDNTRRDARQP